MSMLQRWRRIVAINAHRALLVVGILGLISVPYAWADDGPGVAIAAFLLGVLLVAMSVQLARSLDVQRSVRRLTSLVRPHPAAAEPAALAAAPVPVGTKPRSLETQPLPGRNVTSGRVLVGYGADQLPVIGFAVLAMSEDDARRAVQDVAEHQLISASFKPLLILDEPNFEAARSYGFAAELLIPAREWQGSQANRGEYLRTRLDSLRQSYGCAGVVRIPASGLDDFGRSQVDQLATEWARRHKVALPGTRVHRKRATKTPQASSTRQPFDQESTGLLVGGKQVTS